MSVAEVINLRLARKARQRAEGQAKAAENRAKFGQTKAQRTKAQNEAERALKAIDAHRREDQ